MNDIIEWYESLSDADRLKLQDEFGNYNVADRETKFFKWLESRTPTP